MYSIVRKTPELFMIVITYTVSYFSLLFNHGVYWDDWVLFNMDKELVIDRFRQVGGMINVGYYYSFLFSFEYGPLIYRIITFILYLLVAVLFYKLLMNIQEIDRTSRFFIVILAAVFPVNFSRIAAINTPYIIFLAFFFTAFSILHIYLTRPRILLRLLSLFFFFISFEIGSILFFYATVIMYIYYYSFRGLKLKGSILRWGYRYIDFIMLPIIHWFVSRIFFPSSGCYEAYNQTSLKGLIITGPFYSLNSLITSFIDPVCLAIRPLIPTSNICANIFIASFTAIFFSIILARILCGQLGEDFNSNKHSYEKYLLILGFALFILAVYPYTVVNKIPHLSSWASRHQLLVPFGASFIICYGLKLICREYNISKKLYVLLLSFLIISFIFTNISVSIDYQKDWYKHLSLMHNLAEDENIQKPGTYYFKDMTNIKNATNRICSYYEYSGMLKKVIGDENRIGIDYLEKERVKEKSNYIHASYNIAGYSLDYPEYLVIIEDGEVNVDSKRFLFEMIYYQMFKPEAFANNISNIVIIRVTPYNSM